MKLLLKAGVTSQRIVVFIQDLTSASGAGLTGLTNASSGLTWYYWREDTGNAGGVSVSVVSATRGTFTSGGFIEIDATNLPGFYEIGVPNAALAAGAKWAVMLLKGVTNMVPVPVELELEAVDRQDAAGFGLSRLDAAVSSRSSHTAADVWAATTRLLTAGTNIVLAKGTGVTGFNDLSAAQVNTEADTALADVGLTSTVTGRIDAAVTSRLAPTTAGRTLDVAATGEAGLDFDNVKDASGAHTLTNITVPTVTTAVNLTTNNDKTGYGLSAAAVQAIWDALTSALSTAGSVGKLLVDNINATISSRLASASYTAPPTVGAIADQVWDETLSDHLGAGSTGAGLNAAGAAGDPWSTALPGAYGAGSAGKIVGDNLNATVGSRATQASVDAVDDFVDTEVTAIKAKTDQLTFGTANRVDSTVVDKTGFSLSGAGVQAIWDALTSALTTVGSVGKRIADNVDAAISSRSTYGGGDTAGTTTLLTRIPGTVQPQTGDSFARLGAPAGASVSVDVAAVKVDTAAVKLKTDNLPAAPAATADIPTANANADALLDRAAGVETGWTVRQAMRIVLSVLAGKADGGGTTTMHYRDMADSKNRITAVVDSDGDRTTVTRDAT